MIDTADVYSAWVPGHKGGESEAVIGRWLKRDPKKRDKVIIATKVGMLDGQIVDGEYETVLHPNVIARACDDFLWRLGIERIDLYYQHRDDPKTPLEQSLEAFQRLREEGKIRTVGSSPTSPGRGSTRRSTQPSASASPSRSHCSRSTISLSATPSSWSCGPSQSGTTLASSLITRSQTAFLPANTEARMTSAKAPAVSASPLILRAGGCACWMPWTRLLARPAQPLRRFRFAWLMAQPTIVAPIASATSVDQLRELTAAMELKLSADQLALLDEASAETEPA